MFKRAVILSLLLVLIALSPGMALAQAPFVSITSPLNNAVLSNLTVPVPVTVSFGNAPEGGATLLLQAFDNTNAKIAEISTADVSLIPWQPTLDLSSPAIIPGTTGYLVAYMLDPVGTIIATSPNVAVTYGIAVIATNTPTATASATASATATATATASATPSPTTANTATPTPTNSVGEPQITVSSPIANAMVDPSTNIPVTGSTANMPGGASILLRLRNANGETLGEQSLIPTPNQPWASTITKTIVSIATTNNGSLLAFMILNGSIIAQTDAIPLTFPGISAALVIASPLNGAVIDLSTPVAVSGTSAGLPGDAQIIVQAFAANDVSTPLGQQIATRLVNGNWTASITFNRIVAPGTNGFLIAYAQSGSTTIATSNQVNVTWGIVQVPRITITQPVNNAVIDITHFVRVSGTSRNLPIRQITVRAARSDGSIINEATAAVNNAGNWRVDLPVGVAPGTAGILYAFAFDNGGSIVAQTSITVTWGRNSSSPFILITSPQQGAIVGVGAPVQVNGFETNLFENALVVRALDTFGNVLAQQPVVANAQGLWSASFNVNVAPGTPGSIFAYATSARDGSIIASSRVGVFFGGQCFVRSDWPVYIVRRGDTLLRLAQSTGTSVAQLALANCITNADLVFAGQQLRVPRLPVPPTPAGITFRIIAPVNGAALITTQPVTVNGAGQNLAGNDVVVRALDSNGNLLAQQMTRVTPGVGGEDQWQVSLSINVSDGSRGTLYAFAQSPSSGTIIADALVNVTYGSADNTHTAEHREAPLY